MIWFWAGVGCGVAGATLVLWTLLRASSKDADFDSAFESWMENFSPTQRERMQRPFNWGDDGDWWIKTLREEIANLPETK